VCVCVCARARACTHAHTCTLVLNYVIFQVVVGVAKTEVSANISGVVFVDMLISAHIYILV
jgi:hypothetical protein